MYNMMKIKYIVNKYIASRKLIMKDDTNWVYVMPFNILCLDCEELV